MEMIQGAKSNVVNSYVVSYTKEDEKGNQLKTQSLLFASLTSNENPCNLGSFDTLLPTIIILTKTITTSPTLLIVIIIIIIIIILSALVNFHLFDLLAINIRKNVKTYVKIVKIRLRNLDNSLPQ